MLLTFNKNIITHMSRDRTPSWIGLYSKRGCLLQAATPHNATNNLLHDTTVTKPYFTYRYHSEALCGMRSNTLAVQDSLSRRRFSTHSYRAPIPGIKNDLKRGRPD